MNNCLAQQITNKMVEMPEIKDILEKILELEVDKDKQVTVEINIKDFRNSVNTRFEKIIKGR